MQLALFDFDHTITTCDTYARFLRHVATPQQRYAGGDIGPRKAHEIGLRYALGDYERIHAYGDSREDRGMLALAHERWYAGTRIA